MKSGLTAASTACSIPQCDTLCLCDLSAGNWSAKHRRRLLWDVPHLQEERTSQHSHCTHTKRLEMISVLYKKVSLLACKHRDAISGHASWDMQVYMPAFIMEMLGRSVMPLNTAIMAGASGHAAQCDCVCCEQRLTQDDDVCKAWCKFSKCVLEVLCDKSAAECKCE